MPMNTKRTRHTTVTLPDAIYAFGGYNGEIELSSVERYYKHYFLIYLDMILQQKNGFLFPQCFHQGANLVLLLALTSRIFMFLEELQIINYWILLRNIMSKQTRGHLLNLYPENVVIIKP